MLEKDFESRRQDLFVRASQESLARCDPKDGIIHSVKYAGKDHSMHSRAAGYDIRAMAEAACAWMMSGNETRANLAIELILKNQDMNPDSLTWGNFKWHSDWPLALDPNAVSFIVPQLWYLDKYAGAKINPELRIKLHTALRNACDAIMAHCCTFLYTNIVLLNLASLLCIADRLDWERPRLLAAWAFEEWRNRIGHLGTLPEYNCLTYTWVDIHALAIMLACPAAAAFHNELRFCMRFFIAQALADYHPLIGRITGAQSRAYPNDRQLRGCSNMDVILSFVLPEGQVSAEKYAPWLGVALGPEDILPEARALTIPRTVSAQGAGHSRFNYLGKDFALASIHGRGHWTGHSLPFFLAFKSTTRRCGLPILPLAATQVEAHYAAQDRGSLLAGCSWLRRLPECQNHHSNNFSGLNTGTADNLLEPSFQPGFNLELGTGSEKLQIYDSIGKSAQVGMLSGTSILIQTETLLISCRFFFPGAEAQLRLFYDEQGELILQASANSSPLHLNQLEENVCAAFLLEVIPSQKRTITDFTAKLQKADCQIQQRKNSWLFRGQTSAGKKLRLEIKAETAYFWKWPGSQLSANAWSQSTQE